MTRWGMLADLERCVGCQTCTAACRHTNATLPAVQWRKVIDVEAGTFPNVSRTFVPVGCQHCADPPCMHVCPTTATRQRADGIVTIDYSICIGCAYCEVACPYQARFLLDEPHYAYGAAMQNEVERADDERLGVAQKCTFCSDRIDFGLENGLTPGLDPRATPACVNACIADALHFGDLDDPDSNVSRLLKQHSSFKMHAELGTEPGFHYLYGPANGEGAVGKADIMPAGGGHLRARGAEPELQQHWNWKAAGNFIGGGMGAGLLMASLATGMAGLGEAATLGAAALAIIALGLAVLLLKIGRPLRFIYVLRQPRRSWMAREAWIAGALFPIAAAALWLGAPVLMLVAVLLALAFLFSQAMILRAAKGIPAWRQSRIVPLIVVTGLAEGAGLFLAGVVFRPGLASAVAATAASVVVLAALRFLVWRAYLAALETEGAPQRALAVLKGCTGWLLFGGTFLPVALVLAGAMFAPAAVAFDAAAGLCAAAAGAALKFSLVTRAGFNQGFALVHTPVRGSGVPGFGVKPGWTVGK
jgi:phenylacetyl-CoA:acceptor oxidoreductase subunit 1